MPNFFQRPVHALTNFAKQISHRSQHEESSSEKPNRKSRRQAFFRHIAEASSVKDHSRIVSSNRDWRNLSPMEPPLPAVSASRRVGFSHAVKVVQNLPADMSDLFKRPPPTTRQRASTGSIEDFLYTIPEEDEVHSDDLEDDDILPETEDSTTTTTTSPVSPSSTSPKKSLEPQFKPVLIGNEKECKRKFAKMLHAAYKFQQQQEQIELLGHVDATSSAILDNPPYARKQQNLQRPPREMEVLFNQEDNVEWVKFKFDEDDEGEYRRFQGNVQYIAPEIISHRKYISNQVDVWVLGISLFKMLIGRYPFSAPNDKQLFRKMLTADFTIPDEYSDNVKDLLRRLLAPDLTRASLDLIIFHPWLKPYQIIPKEKTPPESLFDTAIPSPPPKQLVAKRTTSPAPPLTVKDTRDALMEAIAEKRQQYALSQNINSPSNRPGKLMETRSSPLHQEIMLEDSPNTSVRSRLSMPSDAMHNAMSVESSEVPTTQEPTEIEQKRKRRNRKSLVLLGKALADAFSFITDGPFPPPRKPYEQLVHLGRSNQEKALYLQQQQLRETWRSQDNVAFSAR
ncbi:hypothetical protein K450DRAFT_235382 [Umbelopsis ramanniana AG]|uniref:Protein kinase domain-containing protein n=1 Tax=Umbelopsis ramanniana AG TaxID=1314678 RepID=A0AAD5ECU2_UMBRA|nr:uncharacterized protein K450DRAFT_235382 [Umbelopsis ramanniana AG]KAI8580947.1 hypothetical protein K450DRAFT_235382 [Umbelopsis ramanniana AG]